MFDGFSVFHNLQQSMASSPRQPSLDAEDSNPKALVTSSNIEDFFLPVILCLHDSGSSAIIFQSQLRHMEQELGSRFRFIYVNGPFPSTPDPKVLLAFESTGSFYSWVKDMPSSGSEKEDLPQEEIDSIDRVLNQAMMFEGRPDRIWGILGLGQGARLAAGLICREGDRLETGEKFRALKNLQFGIIISGAWPPIMLTEQKKGWIDVLGLQQLPTLYVWGRHAPDHKSYMKMVSKCDWLHTYTHELEGPQYLPVTEKETEQIARRIINLALVPIIWGRQSIFFT
jgi:hypothetical protein